MWPVIVFAIVDGDNAGTNVKQRIRIHPNIAQLLTLHAPRVAEWLVALIGPLNNKQNLKFTTSSNPTRCHYFRRLESITYEACG